MRQQLLAHQMVKAHEQGADVVRLLHITPAHNLDFQRVTSLTLESLGSTVSEVWKKIVKSSDRFMSITTEQLFGNFDCQQFPDKSPLTAH